jgi:hypothetical protein
MLDAGKARADVAALLGVHVGTLRRALSGLDDPGGTSGSGKISGHCTGKKTGPAAARCRGCLLTGFRVTKPLLSLPACTRPALGPCPETTPLFDFKDA